MYKGIKKKEIYKPNIKFPIKIQMLSEEETLTNGILRKQLKVKTIDFTADPNIKYTDFEVNNLLAAGVDITTMPIVKMDTSKEKILQNADTADQLLQQYEFIKERENELKQEQTTE